MRFIILAVLFVSNLAFSEEILPLTAERLSELSQKDKNKVILLLMKGASEMEASQRKFLDYDTKVNLTHFYSLDIYSKRILNFFISDSFASSNPENTKCIFAGWYSEYVTVGDKKVCRHPLNLGDKNELRKKYQEQASHTCIKNQIACNPDLFGKNNEGKVDCVQVDAKNENTSALCLKKVLDDNNFETRINNIELKQCRDHHDELFQDIYKGCLCDNSSSTTINNNYLTHMKKSTTCNSLILQTFLLKEKFKKNEYECYPIHKNNFNQYESIFNDLQNITIKACLSKLTINTDCLKISKSAELKKLVCDEQAPSASAAAAAVEPVVEPAVEAEKPITIEKLKCKISISVSKIDDQNYKVTAKVDPSENVTLTAEGLKFNNDGEAKGKMGTKDIVKTIKATSKNDKQEYSCEQEFTIKAPVITNPNPLQMNPQPQGPQIPMRQSTILQGVN